MTTPSYRRWQIQIFAATWLAYAGYYFCRKAFYVVKADLAESLDLTTIDLAHLGTAYLICYMIGQFSSAFFGRRLGPKLLLLVGMGISLVCNVFFGMANGFWTVLVFLSLNGLAQGTGWPGCIGSLAFWFKREQRGSILGVWATCYQIGSVIAGSFAAFMLGLAGWRWSFFGASIILLGVWFIVLLLHPNRPEDVNLPPIEPDDEDKDKGKDQSKEEGLGWTPSVVVTILLMGLTYFCIKFLRYALWSWTPFFLRRNFSMEGDDAGYLSTVFDFFGFIGVLAAGVVSDKLFKGKRAFLCLLMLVLMTASFVFMYVMGSTSVLYFTISMGMVGFMLYGPDSLISGVGAIDVGSKRGALVAAGIINGMGSAGPVFQEELIGWMYRAYDEQLLPIFLVFIGVALVGSIVMAVLWINSRRGRSKL
jgi:sugar phosphate permease